MKSFYEEALALVSLALFLGTIYVWAVIIHDRALEMRHGHYVSDRPSR